VVVLPAVGTKKGSHLPGLDRETDAVHGLHLLVIAQVKTPNGTQEAVLLLEHAVGLGQAFRLDNRHGARSGDFGSLRTSLIIRTRTRRSAAVHCVEAFLRENLDTNRNRSMHECTCESAIESISLQPAHFRQTSPTLSI
jgi:hypothetical protein